MARKSPLEWIFLLLAIALIPRLFYVGWVYDADLHVYWQAGVRMLAHQSPYSFTAADQGFVIKYAPWTMPFFLPLGFLDWSGARVAWFAMELGCVILLIRWVMAQGVSLKLTLGSALLFWWMWQSHFSAGQLFLPIAASAIWVGSDALESPAAGRAAAAALGLSAKIYPLVACLGIWRAVFRARFWAILFAALVASHVILLWTSPGHSLTALYLDWLRAAASGGAELGPETVRGPGNHGFPALILRTLHVNPLITWPDSLAALATGLGLGAVWARASRKLPSARRWSGWLALGVVAHPLAWQHSFVMVYPLCAFALEAAFAARSRAWIAAAFVAIAMVALIIPPIFGSAWVNPLELLGMKSWGVCLAAAVLARCGSNPGPDLAHRPAAG
jgi:hypothetical protein